MTQHDAVRTNRDLYLFVAGLQKRQKHADRALHDWLGAFYGLLLPWRDKPGIPPTELAHAFERAFSAVVRKPDESDAWEVAQMVHQQMRDLDLARRSGLLKHPHRYFGKQVQGGGYWVNWDPLDFIECGVAGSVRGWAVGDDTGRTLVPGEVAYLDDQGEIRFAASEALGNDSVVELPEMSWQQVVEFLRARQHYE